MPTTSSAARSARSRKRLPGMGVLCDVALDPYTSHGHDGVFEGDHIANDASVEILVRQALVQAEAGCDIIAPSDMMDGRVGAIRAALEHAGPQRHADHGLCREIRERVLRPVPRRGRLGQGAEKATKRTYQMDPANGDEALREVALDIAEGRRHGDGQARHAVSRRARAGEADLRHADLRLSGLRRVFDAWSRPPSAASSSATMSCWRA